MKSQKEIIAEMRTLVAGYSQGNENAFTKLEMLAWATGVPVDFLLDAFGEDAVPEMQGSSQYADLLEKLKAAEEKIGLLTDENTRISAENEELRSQCLKLCQELEKGTGKANKITKGIEDLKKDWEFDKENLKRDVAAAATARKKLETELRNEKEQHAIDLKEKDEIIEKLKKQAEVSGDAGAYLEMAHESDQKARELREENEQLKARLDALNAGRKAAGGTALLVRGGEDDLYDNETLEIVISALRDMLPSIPEGRRKDVVSSVIDANPVDNIPGEMTDKVKQLLKNFRNFDTKTEKGLKEFGIVGKTQGRHMKLVYRGDERYVTTAPTSSSDVRAGMNLASEIIKTMF